MSETVSESAKLFEEAEAKLDGGKINDAFLLAARAAPLCLENLRFVRLLGKTLFQLGFIDEAYKVSAFVEDSIAFRTRHQDALLSELDAAKELGYSKMYEAEGVRDDLANPVWDNRAKVIARWIPAGAHVLDMGCGNMLIEKYLKEPADYIPCDIAKRDERTIVCDFDKFEYPPMRGENLVLCLGVVNYLKHQKELLEHLCARGKSFLFTFKPRELIAAKVQKGFYPEAIGFKEATDLVAASGFQLKCQYVLGQGDEILLIANK